MRAPHGRGGCCHLQARVACQSVLQEVLRLPRGCRGRGRLPGQRRPLGRGGEAPHAACRLQLQRRRQCGCQVLGPRGSRCRCWGEHRLRERPHVLPGDGREEPRQSPPRGALPRSLLLLRCRRRGGLLLLPPREAWNESRLRSRCNRRCPPASHDRRLQHHHAVGAAAALLLPHRRIVLRGLRQGRPWGPTGKGGRAAGGRRRCSCISSASWRPAAAAGSGGEQPLQPIHVRPPRPLLIHQPGWRQRRGRRWHCRERVGPLARAQRLSSVAVVVLQSTTSAGGVRWLAALEQQDMWRPEEREKKSPRGHRQEVRAQDHSFKEPSAITHAIEQPSAPMHLCAVALWPASQSCSPGLP